jgi:hypothetical protein
MKTKEHSDEIYLPGNWKIDKGIEMNVVEEK